MVLLILLALSILGTVVWGVEETPHTRKVFYVGGSYVNDSSGNHVLTDQMYVEQLTPVGGSTKPHPLVFIHGLGQTGVVSQLEPYLITHLALKITKYEFKTELAH